MPTSIQPLVGVGGYRQNPRHFLLIPGNRHCLARALYQHDDFRRAVFKLLNADR